MKNAAAEAREGAESILQESPDGDRRANGSSDRRYVVRVVPCAPKVPRAPKESRSRTTAEIRRKYFVEAQAGTAEAEQSKESGEVHNERGDARVQRTRNEGARQGTVLISFAAVVKNEQLKTDKIQTARDRDPRTLKTKRAVPTAGVKEEKTQYTASATAMTSNTVPCSIREPEFRLRQERRC